MGPQGPPTRAAPPLLRALRSARGPPVDYVDKPLHRRVTTKGVQFFVSPGAQLLMSFDSQRRECANYGPIHTSKRSLARFARGRSVLEEPVADRPNWTTPACAPRSKRANPVA